MEHDSLHSGRAASLTSAARPNPIREELEELSPHHILRVLEKLEHAVNAFHREHDDEYLVDEYTPKTLAGDSETVLTLQPQFRRFPEIIDRIIVTGPALPAMATLDSSNSLAAPAANTAITTIGAGVPGTTYNVTWTVGLDGTVSGTDANNFQLRLGNTTIVSSTNAAAVGRYPQGPITLTIPAGGANVVVRSNGNAGTAGSVYSAQLVLTVAEYTVTLQLGDRIWPNLSLPATGLLEISTKNLILQPQHIRQLTAAQAGQYSLELIGRAGYVRAITGSPAR
jgi:hypothetical protein